MGVSREDYKRCLEAVELQEIWLAKLRAEAKTFDEAAPLLRGSGGLQASIEVKTTHRFDNATNKLTVYVTAHVTGRPAEGADPGEASSLIELESTFALVYSFESTYKVEEPVVTLFIRRNVPINVWPYIREIISDLTVRMGYPRLILPTLKVLR
ncbi:MAG: hypothetical protein DIU82_11730 [Bacillota bacterium]|nr:MAG: hypothetical protein DIU82_11730 [Bacillota bacterium]